MAVTEATEQSTAHIKPDCYKCKHRRNPPGTAHSSCAHPKAGNDDPMGGILAIFASVGRHPPVIGSGAGELGIKANEIGVRNGWFNWPFDFDPTWLEACNGFTSKGDP